MKKRMAIRYRLRALIEDKEIREGRRLTYRTIRDEARISTNTLTSMINQDTEYISRTTLDKLCQYFDCTPGDIIIYIPDEEIKPFKNGTK